MAQNLFLIIFGAFLLTCPPPLAAGDYPQTYREIVAGLSQGSSLSPANSAATRQTLLKQLHKTKEAIQEKFAELREKGKLQGRVIMKITGGGLRIEVREGGTNLSAANSLNSSSIAHPGLEIIARELGRLPFDLVDIQVSTRVRARRIGGIAPRCAFSKGGGGGNIDKLIHKYAAHYRIDPGLIKAIMRRESGFNPDAVSPKGAQGLMQLMPGTSTLMGVKNPFDPEQNIAGGVAYLRHCLDRFDDNVVLAVAAYNAGPHRVAKCGDIPPIAETQVFVQNVVAEYLDLSGKSRTDSGLAYPLPAKQSSPAVSPSLFRLPRKHRPASARHFSITLIEIKPKACSKLPSLKQ